VKRKVHPDKYDPTPIHVRNRHAVLDLKRGHIPVFKNETTSVVRDQYPENLVDCKYARCVDQHHIIFSLAEGMASALLMVVDAISDLYFGLQLFTSPLYDKLALRWKIAYVSSCALGIFGWVSIAAFKTVKVPSLHTATSK
jgi:hypothetical protein